jgi:lysophospholipase L1-like esterase
VIGKNDPIKDAGSTPTLAIRQLTGTPTASSSGTTAHVVVAFLGDDYTKGVGASAPGKRFTTLIAGSLKLTERNFGVDGSGYARRGYGGKIYANSVDRLVMSNPSAVVVSGGRNDVTDDSSTFAAAAHALFAELHKKLPHASLIAIAPLWGDSDHPAELAGLAAVIESAVQDAGGTYVDLPDPLHNRPNDMADDADPNDAGYAAIAAALRPRFLALLPR